jgi:outer membrane lipoprotein-sorting protein
MVDAKKMICLFCLGGLFLLPGRSPAQSAPQTKSASQAKTVSLAQTTSPAQSAPAKTASPASSADLQKVITQLNTAAGKFGSAQADFSWDQYQEVVQEDDVQTGTIYFERKKGGTRTAAYLKKDNGKDALKTVVYDNGEAQFYEPNIKQLTILRAGANRGQWESFLTLGFGGSGTELQANWKVSLLGSESLNGVQVAKLDLVPLQQKVLDMFTHVTIWIDPTQGISYKQIFFEAGGDKRTATYKNIRYNQPIASDVFEIKPAPGTNRVVR